MRLHALILIATLASTAAACVEPEAPDLDARVRGLALEAGAASLAELEPRDPARVELGRMLFFDPELSGNRDTSCATCHHPTLNTGDGLSLSVGTGGQGLGPERQMGEHRELVPRNATEIYNRGAPEWRTMFWDMRVRLSETGAIVTPAGGWLPEPITDVLEAQALFPVTSRDEMRGERGDLDVYGRPNELAMIYESRPYEIWEALMARILVFPRYVELFEAAFPEVPADELGFAHAAIAIAAFEAEAFHVTDSPWDAYMRGDDDAMSEAQKRGAELFFGRAGCADCHNGVLLTDQLAHSLAVPQLGPGKGNASPMDNGFGAITGRASDALSFRTPPLRNVALTGPWMHDGAYTSLEAAVRHHLDPIGSCESYDEAQLAPRFRDEVQSDPAAVARMTASLSPLLAEPPALSDAEVDDLLAFLEALTSPSAAEGLVEVPAEVPSGLPVE